MQNKGKTIAGGLLMVTIVLAFGYGAAMETAVAKSEKCPGQETVLVSDQAEDQEKREAFDKRFAERKARFEKEYNEVKQIGEQIKEKFRNCRTPDEEEVRTAVVRNLGMRGR